MELWQLYDEQGRPIAGKGAGRDEVFLGLLHASSHVWIWRMGKQGAEVLLQKRAAAKQTWPNKYDISAAGHVDLGEDPLAAALRETKEEIGITVAETDLKLITVARKWLTTEDGRIENEFCWVYILQVQPDLQFELEDEEVADLVWKPLDVFQTEYSSKGYVPHEQFYYKLVANSIETCASAKVI